MFRSDIPLVLALCLALRVDSLTVPPPSPLAASLTRGQAISAVAGLLGFVSSPASEAFADEYGQFIVEKDQKPDGNVCVKRNLLGKCDEYGKADEEQPLTVRANAASGGNEESDLVKQLKARSEANKARNEQIVAEKSFMNSQSGEFGPFSRYVPIKHPSTGQYELVLVRDLERMEKQGIIKDNAFVESVKGKEKERDASLEEQSEE